MPALPTTPLAHSSDLSPATVPVCEALDAAGIFAHWHTTSTTSTLEPPAQPRHALIAYANCQTESGPKAEKAEKAEKASSLRNAWLLPTEKSGALELLLRGMQPASAAESVNALPQALTPPHEHALAHAIGLVAGVAGNAPADGLIPWAALEACLLGLLPSNPEETGWAWITPCHWSMGIGQATFTHPAHLPALSETDSRRLLEAMRPYWAEDGITLHYRTPHRWLAEGTIFRQLPTASLDQVVGRSIDGWLPVGTPAASTIRRLQGEMQMLLYTHPVNDERSEQRQLPMNSFWISGTGDLLLDAAGARNAAAKAASIEAPRTLAEAFQTGNVPAFAEAWQAINTSLIARLLHQQNNGQPVQLTLCGLKQAQTFASRPAGLAGRVQALFAGLFGVSASKHLHEQL